MRGTILAMATSLLAAACGSGGTFFVTVTFPDQVAKDQARHLQVAAVTPGDGASCQALQDGSAAPGDLGYTVQDEVDFDLPISGTVRPLHRIGPGQRLFFARATDTNGLTILRGCTEAKAGKGEVGEVTIALAWTCQPTNGGVEKCDGLDNDCDGLTDEGDPVALCPEVRHAKATACTLGRCSYGCLPEFVNTNGEWSDGCECHLTRGGVEWCDGLDNDCDGATDGAGCRKCVVKSDCVDDSSCLDGDCQGGTCTATVRANGAHCDDGSACTTGDACQDGVCQGTAVSCDDGNPCTDDACDPVKGCTHAANTVSCDDGNPCTGGDTCNGAGQCHGITVGCTSPPANECVDAQTARHYDSIGQCNPTSGQCEYGQHDESCAMGCFNGGCRSSQCQGMPVGTKCDDQDTCTENDACDAYEVCLGTAKNCDDANVCTNDSCDKLLGCQHVPNTDNCDDGDPCTVADICSQRKCAGVQKNCNDGLSCTTDHCESDGSCSHTVAQGFCVIQGLCQPQGAKPAGQPCQVCDPARDPHAWSLVAAGTSCGNGNFCNSADTCDANGVCQPGNPCTQICRPTCDESTKSCQPSAQSVGSPCDDGFSCTNPDACDAAGNCVGTPDNSRCASGVCAPRCSPNPDGCMALPALQVTCPAVVQNGLPASCTISLGGLTGQLGCLQCAAYVLPIEVSRVDFSLNGSPGTCDLEGWQLYPSGCYSRLHAPNCSLGETGRACCTNFSCPISVGLLAGRVAMQSYGTTCAIVDPSGWRLEREFDLREFDAGSVCFDAAVHQGSSGEVVQVQVAQDSSLLGTVLDCLNGNAFPIDTFVTHCQPLPATVFQWLPVGITFWTEVAVSAMAVFLDNVVLTAWYQGCATGTSPVFTEQFNNCAGALQDGWNGWSVQGQVICGSANCSAPSASFQGGTNNSLTHRVDTTALSDHVFLCWSTAHAGSPAGTFTVDFDAGTGFQAVSSINGNFGTDTTCRQRCVDLAAIDPAALDNPSLNIRFQGQINTGTVSLDDITVSDGRCDASALGFVSIGTIQASGNEYQVQLTSGRSKSTHGILECSWTGSQPMVKTSAPFFFQAP